MEIRQAEKIIDQLKQGGFSEPVLLPTNNWSKYNYLFIKDLDRDELDLINSFYNQCVVIDKALLQMSITFQLEQKSGYIHQALVQMAKDESEKITDSKTNMQNFFNKKDSFLRIIENDGYGFNPTAPRSTIMVALNNLVKITTSTSGSKLKKISQTIN